MQLWPVEHFFHHKRVPFCDEKSDQPEVHLSEVTSYKIHILDPISFYDLLT